MRDLEIAQEFFQMLKNRGFQVEITDYSGRKFGEEEFDWDSVSFELIGSYGQFASFDFLSKNFYRISAYTDGNWQDEADWKKY